jgi:hypothetical protein
VGVVVRRIAGGDGVGAVGGGGHGDGAELGHRVVAGLELGLVEHLGALERIAAVTALDRPMPRRSTATTGWLLSMSVPERVSHTGSCSELGVRAGGEHHRAGVGGVCSRSGAHRTHGDLAAGAVDRVQVGVVGGAVQGDAGRSPR